MLADDIMENDCVVQPDGSNAVSVVDATIFHLNLLDILWDVLSSCLVLMYSFVFLTPRLLVASRSCQAPASASPRNVPLGTRERCLPLPVSKTWTRPPTHVPFIYVFSCECGRESDLLRARMRAKEIVCIPSFVPSFQGCA